MVVVVHRRFTRGAISAARRRGRRRVARSWCAVARGRRPVSERARRAGRKRAVAGGTAAAKAAVGRAGAEAGPHAAGVGVDAGQHDAEQQEKGSE